MDRDDQMARELLAAQFNGDEAYEFCANELPALLAEIDRLRAEVGELHMHAQRRDQYAVEKAAQALHWKDRAERLEEALRGIRRDALDGCSAMDCARDAFDVLRELDLLREQEEGRDE